MVTTAATTLVAAAAATLVATAFTVAATLVAATAATVAATLVAAPATVAATLVATTTTLGEGAFRATIAALAVLIRLAVIAAAIAATILEALALALVEAAAAEARTPPALGVLLAFALALLLLELHLGAHLEDALHNQRCIATAGQLEAQLHEAATAVQAILFRRTHAQVAGNHDQGTVLALECHARDAFDVELFGGQTFGGENALEDGLVVAAIFQVGARQAQSCAHHQVRGGGAFEGGQCALVRSEHRALFLSAGVANEQRSRAVPDVALVCVQMDQADPRRREVEGAGEVLWVLLQVIEDREVLAEAAADARALAPVAPVATDVALVALVARRVEGRGPEQHALQGLFRVAEHQLARNPSLIVAQVAKALVVEVVDQAVLAHAFQVVAKHAHVLAPEGAHGDLETVAATVVAGQLGLGEAGVLDAKIAFVHRSLAVLAGHAHVLSRHRLTVLQSGELNVTGIESRFGCQGFDGLRRSHLLLGDAVDRVLTLFGEVVVAQKFANVEVTGSLFESHDL